MQFNQKDGFEREIIRTTQIIIFIQFSFERLQGSNWYIALTDKQELFGRFQKCAPISEWHGTWHLVLLSFNEKYPPVELVCIQTKTILLYILISSSVGYNLDLITVRSKTLWMIYKTLSTPISQQPSKLVVPISPFGSELQWLDISTRPWNQKKRV